MKRAILFMVIILPCLAYTQPLKKCATVITGTADYLREGDTVKLEIIKYGDFSAVKEFNETFTSIVKNSRCQFSISFCMPVYINLLFSQQDRKLNIYSYLIEPGSEISVHSLKADSFEFSGKDSRKFQIQYEKRKIWMAGSNRVKNRRPTNIIRAFATLDSFSFFELAYLKSKDKALGNTLYTILFFDVLGRSALKIDNLLPYKSPEIVEVWRNTLKEYKDPIWGKYNSNDVNSSLLQYSYTYANALIARYRWDSCIIAQNPFDVIECYKYFAKALQGELRERVITTLLYANRSETAAVSYCLQSAFGFISNKDFDSLLRTLKANLTMGSAAYQFKLQDTSGFFREYEEFKNKVILLDFWFTGCRACIEVHPKLDSIISMYKDDQIVLISVSIDKDRKKWISSVDKEIYTSKHSINLFTNGAGDSHPIISHYLIGSYPKLILIDKNGKLCDNPIDPRLDNGANLVKLVDQTLKF